MSFKFIRLSFFLVICLGFLHDGVGELALAEVPRNELIPLNNVWECYLDQEIEIVRRKDGRRFLGKSNWNQSLVKQRKKGLRRKYRRLSRSSESKVGTKQSTDKRFKRIQKALRQLRLLSKLVKNCTSVITDDDFSVKIAIPHQPTPLIEEPESTDDTLVPIQMVTPTPVSSPTKIAPPATSVPTSNPTETVAPAPEITDQPETEVPTPVSEEEQEPFESTPLPELAPTAVATISATLTPTATPTNTSQPSNTPTPGPQSKVPVFLAQGHAGRLIMSCDDGLSWTNNTDQTVDSEVRCWDGKVIERDGSKDVFGCTKSGSRCDDCDHQSWAGRGLAHINGAFLATWGWGARNGIYRSEDLVEWAQVSEISSSAGLAVGEGAVMNGKAKPYLSKDQGFTWESIEPPLQEGYNARSIFFAPLNSGGRFLLYGDGNRLNSIDAAGQDWIYPNKPEECAGSAKGVASNGVTIVSSHYLRRGKAYLCYSDDGGASWTAQQFEGSNVTEVFWNGSHFIVWIDQQAFTSLDGREWQKQPLSPQNLPSFGSMAKSDSGTFVMVSGGWQRWYEQQRFFRSTDGINWEELDANSYVGSHPIRDIEFGYTTPHSQGCPVSEIRASD